MPSEVRHLVDGGQAYPVVRLAGVLDAGSVPAVRSAVLGVLGDQPEAVVIDVRELSVPRPGTAAVLGELARETAAWPGAPLVLCIDGTAADWREAGLPMRPTLEAAFTELGQPRPTDYLSAPLEPITGAARRSRELVAEACARWDRVELAGPACIVITEMVNNVVAHARTSMTVLLALHGAEMTVAVRDDSPEVPRFTGEPVPVTSYGGRGLLLIDSVAARWGSLPMPGGKVVWAALAPEDEPLPAGEAPGTTGGDPASAGMAPPTRG